MPGEALVIHPELDRVIVSRVIRRERRGKVASVALEVPSGDDAVTITVCGNRDYPRGNGGVEK
jgi:hypothetical protein